MRTLAWMVLAAVLCGLTSRAGDADGTAAVEPVLARLEAQFAGLHSVSADFVQEKRMALFRDPVVIRGRMAIRDDGAFAWHVREPVRCSLVMQAGRLRQWDGETGKIQDLDLRASPVFQTVFAQLRHWFSGQFSELRASYAASLAGTHPLAVRFAPLDATRKVLAAIVVVLQDDSRYIQRVTVEETSGDTTVITFTNTVLNGTLDKSVWMLPPGVQDGR